MKEECCNIFEVFDEENNLIKEYTHWKLLLRKKNTKLGACVLITKRHLERFSDTNNEEMLEFGAIVKEVENALKKSFNYDKINWLMLMMKDKHTHFHIMPRYNESKTFTEREWKDEEGPNPLIQKLVEPIPQDILNQIKAEIKKNLN
ncbi:HIT family protein [Candidatus Woesearchaeota archaeon]|jgi:diadenosine tetraphosphate (Ap4A) HIT family hydrolase|nr:HIT family protein [Candidatus Woesearchaeota archaeon]MBT4111113.1 HIT family protein [Candidatus Woesearchaeota archaeon]MBT4335757.1 HIT family protein [Candidatus Woesearchaeota archaeon]MBT4469280.1 HIT family protein [Candidatus Woesearchaeota archaeon]MBT6744252.1 HIT family protein [Candidatus Woesearchaeota archaeon]